MLRTPEAKEGKQIQNRPQDVAKPVQWNEFKMTAHFKCHQQNFPKHEQNQKNWYRKNSLKKYYSIRHNKNELEFTRQSKCQNLDHRNVCITHRNKHTHTLNHFILDKIRMQWNIGFKYLIWE